MKTNRGGRDWLTLQSILQRQMSSILLHDSQTCINNVFFLQSEFDTLTSNQAAELYKSKRMYFEQGDKANRLLAHQLWHTASSQKIPQLPNISIDSQMMNLVIIAALYIHLKLSQTHLWPELVLCHVWSSSFTQIKLLKPRRIYLSRNFPTLLNQCKV